MNSSDDFSSSSCVISYHILGMCMLSNESIMLLVSISHALLPIMTLVGELGADLRSSLLLVLLASHVGVFLVLLAAHVHAELLLGGVDACGEMLVYCYRTVSSEMGWVLVGGYVPLSP